MIGPSCINMDICYVLCSQGSLLLCRYLLPVFSEFHQKLHMISTTSNSYSFWKTHSNFMLFCSFGRQLCLTHIIIKKNPSFRNLWTQWLEHWNLYLSQQYNVDWLLSLLLTRFHNNKLAASVGFPGGSEVKASARNVGDLGSIPGLGRSPGEGNGNPLQYSCLLIPWTEKPGRLQSMGLQRVGHDWATSLSVDRLEMLSLKTSVFSVTFIKLVTFNNPDFF